MLSSELRFAKGIDVIVDAVTKRCMIDDDTEFCRGFLRGLSRGFCRRLEGLKIDSL